MSVRTEHSTVYTRWFVTFTCCNWLPLFQLTKSYDLVYRWFDYLHQNKLAEVKSFVIMPNHFHAILQLTQTDKSLNKVVANGKRFIAYEIIKRLQEAGQVNMLLNLSNAVYAHEKKKGQKHKVFEPSFDAKPIFTDKFLLEKLNYIHYNPVRGKWKLSDTFTDYEHSSAAYYELGTFSHFKPKDYRSVE